MNVTRGLLLLSLAASLQGGPRAGEEGQIVEALALTKGMRAADVGAGEGRFTTFLAAEVGKNGHVYATEVEEDELEKIRKRVESEGHANVTTIRGDQKDTGLAPGCCDAILLRLVYHHFTDPPAMRESLWRALRPGGRIAVIEVPPQSGWRPLPGVPDRGGHGIAAEALVAEMQGAGFELVTRHETWPAETDSYCAVFRRPPSPSAAAR
jgi:ubiquinone/menaquinone biosynthesis C-methylase UbiE